MSIGRDKTIDMLKLATAFFDNLRISDIEFGGIGLDDKRPFGNSDVVVDILEIIGLEPSEIDEDGYECYTEDEEDYAEDLYSDLIPFLQIWWKKGQSLDDLAI